MLSLLTPFVHLYDDRYEGGLGDGKAEKPTYEFVESKQLYRKRVKGHDGKYISLYGKTPQELSVKIEEFL